MKPTTKKVLIIAAILVAAGLLLATAAWALGAATSISPRSGVSAQQRHEVNATLSAFERVEVRLPVSDVSIRHGDEFRVEGHIYTRDFHYGVEGNTLVLRGEEEVRRMPRIQIGFFNRVDLGGNLRITVPSHVELENMSFRVGVGDVTIIEVLADSLSISAGVGEVLIEGIDAQEISIEAGVGGLEVRNVNVRDVSMEAGVGDISFTGTFTGRGTIDVGTGSVSLRILDSEDYYAYDLQVGVGGVRIDGQSTGGLGANVSRSGSNPQGNLRVQVGVGDVTLDFLG